MALLVGPDVPAKKTEDTRPQAAPKRLENLEDIDSKKPLNKIQ